MSEVIQTSEGMPKYQSHKIVSALKIKNVSHNEGGGAVLFWENTDYQELGVNSDWIGRHKPHAGGYYVRYEDGYTSFSPARAFEEGYLAV